MLTSLFTEISSNLNLMTLIICTIVSLFLGLIVAFTHLLTSRSSKNFLVTLAILPVLVQVVMIMVNGNLGTSVAILGAFSLIRFRSAAGTSKEILSVFFAMAIGLATGMGHAFFAAVMTIIIALAIIVLSKVPIFGSIGRTKKLKITVPEDLDYNHMFDEVFEQYTSTFELEQVRTVNMGSLFDLSYRVALKPNINEKEFLDAIRIKNGNLRVILSHSFDGTEF